MRHSKLAIVPLGILLLGLPLAAASADGSCPELSVHGVAGPTIFLDDFESGDTSAWGVPFVPRYSTVATIDLTVEVGVDGALAGDHLLTLAWRLPGGGLYQSVAVPFTVAETAGSGTAPPARRVAGYPFPVATRVAHQRSGEAPGGALLVEDRLPVAGTSIVEASLWGEWQLDVRLDDEDAVCASTNFRMEP